jgi:hypothetical protein
MRACRRRARSRRSTPAIARGIVLAPGLHISEGEAVIIDGAAPHNHLAASPHGSEIKPTSGCIGVASNCPTVSRRIVSPAITEVRMANLVPTTPHDHLGSGPDCAVMKAAGWRTGGARAGPTISSRVVLAAGVKRAGAVPILAAPYNHLAAGPDCAVIEAARRRTGRARCRPRVS